MNVFSNRTRPKSGHYKLQNGSSSSSKIQYRRALPFVFAPSCASSTSAYLLVDAFGKGYFNQLLI